LLTHVKQKVKAMLATDVRYQATGFNNANAVPAKKPNTENIDIADVA